MAAVDKVTVKGISGNVYNFEVYPWNSTWNPVAVVYLVLKKNGGVNYDLLYVGQTSDLKQRFDDHHKQGSFDRHGRTHVAVKMESTEKTRLAIELDLINKHNPCCNG
jgi:predicted GIY-YIG superfamily endonuclease